jgi:glutamate N-acetyltransferase/amino-acid N-acetyltransferase
VVSGKARAVLANAGCANACTGARGYEDAIQSAQWVAEAVGIAEDDVLVASTGTIGTYLPMDRIREGIPRLVGNLNAEGLPDVSRAIMTTDTRPKWTERSFSLGGFETRIGAVTKGAGMIHPQMATMLCFVMTDAAVSSELLQRMLVRGLGASFHAITIDGDTSTNDTVLVLANGASGGPALAEGSKEAEVFEAELHAVLCDMALEIVRDAEGLTKVIHLVVEGASDDASAGRVARTIAHSPLVKTAFYGEEVNWGRIMAAAGYSGIEIDPQRVSLWYGDVELVVAGQSKGIEAEDEAQEIARKEEFTVKLSLGMGEGKAIMHTCDLTHDYITINASYKT